MKALDRDREGRYKSAAEFADALRAVPGEAPRAEISAWVHRTVSEVLAQRLKAVEALEAMDIASTGSSQLQVEQALKRPATTRRSGWASPAKESTTTVTFERESTGALATEKRSGASYRTAWGVGLGLLIAFGSAIGVASFATHDSPVMRAASSSVPAPTASAPEFTHSLDNAPDPKVEAPIVRVEQLASAPIAPARNSIMHKGVSLKRTAPRRAAPPAQDCNPPYKIDASGVRRVRFECL